MKIAFLLRGQCRLSKETAELFNKFVIDRQEELGITDIKIFVNTWHTVSKMMTDENSETMLPPRYDSEWLSTEDVLDHVLPWGPSWYKIQDEKRLFNIVHDVVTDISNDRTIGNWITEHFRNYKSNNNLKERGTHYNLISPSSVRDFDEARRVFDIPLMSEMFMINYILGQVYSTSTSYECLKEYQSQFPDYAPDLIISSRLDVLPYFRNRQQLIHIQDTLRSMHRVNSECVGVNGMFVEKGIPVIQDYMFFMLPETAKQFFLGPYSHIEENIRDLFTVDKHRLLRLIDSGHFLQHALWLEINRTARFQVLNDTVQLACLRPSNKFDNYRNMQPTYNNFRNIIQADTNAYTYPSNIRDLTANEMIGLWTKYMPDVK